jgi:glycosyltransferase involved in cell wall biosynthesis
MSVPPVTVLMPVYNAENYLREAMDSILNQTFRDFEFVIVNDGSTDHSEEIIRSYRDERIRLVNRPNGGVSAALNTGLQEARGKFIARFDADDICTPERLHEQYEFMTRNPEYVLIGSDADYISKTGEYIFTYNSPGYTDEEIREKIFERNPFIHSVVFYPKAVINRCGGYDPRAHTFEDHLLWVKVIAFGKVCNFRKSYIKVRLSPESVTTDERLWGRKFLELRRQILMSNTPVSDEQEARLLAVIKSSKVATVKGAGYHLFVAKKLLWNNHRPAEARKHLVSSMKIKPLLPANYFLYFLSFLPEAFIYRLYQLLR